MRLAVREAGIMKKIRLGPAVAVLVWLSGAGSLCAADLQELRQACELAEDAEACLQAGMIYRSGDGVPKDPAAAESMFAEACEFGGEEGCVDAFALILNEARSGRGADPQVVTAAEDNLAIMCEDGVGSACYVLGEYYEKEFPERAWEYYDAACALEIEHACL